MPELCTPAADDTFKGWPDEAKAWLGPDALMKRFEWSQALAQRIGRNVDPRQVLDDSLGEMAGKATQKTVRGADSREQGLVLALMAPEFQRR